MQSMTGFGRAEAAIGNTQYTIELKSVNHRYLDARFRLPTALSALELSMTEVLRSAFERGSFEINVRQKVPTGTQTVSNGVRFLVDHAAAKSLKEGLDLISKTLSVPLTLNAEALIQSNRVFVTVDDGIDPLALWSDLKGLFQKTVQELKVMRMAEGKRIHTILSENLNEITRLVDLTATLAPEQGKKIAEKLHTRLAQWKLGTEVDSQRLEWEVALFAERADITEEIDRLRSHVKEFQSFLKTDKPVGRKLDFLTQELHREANTMGSKTTSLEITQHVVSLKAAIEKLREQVQNVE